jgi:hypothetical protein
MSDDIIARAEAALEGVTDGPWSCYGNMAHEVFQEPTADSEGADVAHSVCHIEDSRFIAAARTLVPALVAELKTARAELEQLPSADDFHNAAQAILYWSESDNCDDSPECITFLRGLAERMDQYGYALDRKVPLAAAKATESKQ